VRLLKVTKSMRRDPLEIMAEIIALLEKTHEPLSLNSIAERTGIHNVTVKKYVRMIEIVRKEPDIEIIRTRHSVIIRVRR